MTPPPGLRHRPISPMRNTSFVLLLLAALMFCLPAWGAEKFIFGWSAISGAQAVPWIAKEAGLFEKHGTRYQPHLFGRWLLKTRAASSKPLFEGVAAEC